MALLEMPIWARKVLPNATIADDANTIIWRPMVINWFGSMFFIGLCAPLMVWFTVYCIRTRKSRTKAKAKPGIGPSALHSTRPFVGGRDMMEMYDSAPLAQIPPGRHNSSERVPMSTQFRRYLGWWSSGSSREANYPRDPRARKDRDRPYTKRGHFLRYFGWWTGSEETAKIIIQNRKRKPKPDVTSESTGFPNDFEAFELPQLDPIPQARWLGRHQKTCLSLESLAEQGQLRSNQELKSVEEPRSSSLSTQNAHANSTGADINQSDRSRGYEFPENGKIRYGVTGGLSTDETSGLKTVRRRTVGVAEAFDWANLSSELRRSFHTQALLPDKKGCVSIPAEEISQAIAALVDTPSVDDETSPTASLPINQICPPIPASKLRKVHSSPTLHLAFKQYDASPERFLSKSVKASLFSHSNLIPLTSQPNQVEGLAKNFNPFQSLKSSTAIYSVEPSILMNIVNVSQTSLALSFDKSRRSTLEIARRPAEPDRQTLEEYEAESSIDIDISTRDVSGTTTSSFRRNPSRRAALEEGNTDDFFLNLKNLYPDRQTQEETDCNAKTGFNVDLEVRKFFNQEPLRTTHGPRECVDRLLVSQHPVTDRFATVNLPIRRYSNPSFNKELDVISELKRKFTSRSLDLEEKAEEDANCERHRSLPRHLSKIPDTGLTGSGILMVVKKRSSRSGKSRTQRILEVKPRKLTPFVSWNKLPTPKNSPRKTILKTCQTLDHLSEAASFRSKNGSLLIGRCGATSQACDTFLQQFEEVSGHSDAESLRVEAEPTESSNPQDKSTTQTLMTCPTSSVQLTLPVTPGPHFFSMPAFIPSTEKARCTEPLALPYAQAIAGDKPPRILETISSISPVLTEMQLSTTGSLLKRNSRSQSSAEKARRRESMREAGKLLFDGNVLNMTL